MIREIRHHDKLIAILLTHDHSEAGLNFFTSKDLTLQAGYMKYPPGYRILPHVHHRVVREVDYTLEAVLVKTGTVDVDLYTEKKEYIRTERLVAGDMILLASGGHGFQFVEEGELVEIKQGPYVSQEVDKEKFQHPVRPR